MHIFLCQNSPLPISYLSPWSSLEIPIFSYPRVLAHATSSRDYCSLKSPPHFLQGSVCISTPQRQFCLRSISSSTSLPLTPHPALSFSRALLATSSILSLLRFYFLSLLGWCGKFVFCSNTSLEPAISQHITDISMHQRMNGWASSWQYQGVGKPSFVSGVIKAPISHSCPSQVSFSLHSTSKPCCGLLFLWNAHIWSLAGLGDNLAPCWCQIPFLSILATTTNPDPCYLSPRPLPSFPAWAPCQLEVPIQLVLHVARLITSLLDSTVKVQFLGLPLRPHCLLSPSLSCHELVLTLGFSGDGLLSSFWPCSESLNLSALCSGCFHLLETPHLSSNTGRSDLAQVLPSFMKLPCFSRRNLPSSKLFQWVVLFVPWSLCILQS